MKFNQCEIIFFCYHLNLQRFGQGISENEFQKKNFINNLVSKVSKFEAFEKYSIKLLPCDNISFYINMSLLLTFNCPMYQSTSYLNRCLFLISCKVFLRRPVTLVFKFPLIADFMTMQLLLIVSNTEIADDIVQGHTFLYCVLFLYSIYERYINEAIKEQKSDRKTYIFLCFHGIDSFQIEF